MNSRKVVEVTVKETTERVYHLEMPQDAEAEDVEEYFWKGNFQDCEPVAERCADDEIRVKDQEPDPETRVLDFDEELWTTIRS